MSALDILIPRLKVAEGFRANIYTDVVGKRTIGYGCNLDAGITEHAASALLFSQAQEVQALLSAYPWFNGLDDVRASVILEIAFNCGIEGLLQFHLMIAAIQAGNWAQAHDQLLDSAAARLLPKRYFTLAELLRKGA